MAPSSLVKLTALAKKRYQTMTWERSVAAWGWDKIVPSQVPAASQAAVRAAVTADNPRAVTIVPLARAPLGQRQVIQKRLGAATVRRLDWWALTTSKSWFVITIAPQATVTVTIKNTFGDALPVFWVFAGPKSSLTLTEYSSPRTHLGGSLVFIQSAPDSQVHYATVQLTNGVTQHLTDASVGARSTINLYEILAGSGTIHQTTRITLAGRAASATATTLANLHSGLLSTDISLNHQSPQTTGRSTTRVIGQGTSRSHLNGLVTINRRGTETDSFLEQRALLCTPTASAVTIPNLTIQTNDVKASHSATTSQLDADQLLYLAARGVSPAVATNMLTAAFWRAALTPASPASVVSAVEKISQRV